MLWILNNIPEWVIHSALVAGLAIFVLSWIIARFPVTAPSAIPAWCLGLTLITVGLIFEGGLIIKKDYDLKEAQLQAKIAALNSRADKITVETIERLVYRDRVIVAEGARITEYINQAAEKIDATCRLSDEFIEAHNQAARGTE